MSDQVYTPGTLVTYWGNVSKYYGRQMRVVYANACGCKHQTYCVETVDSPHGRLEKVMHDSLRVIEEN